MFFYQQNRLQDWTWQGFINCSPESCDYNNNFFLLTAPSIIQLRSVTSVNKTTVRVDWSPPYPANGPLEHMWYRIKSRLGGKEFYNESRETTVDLSFIKDCGSETEELEVQVTALMKQDPQNVLEGPASQPQNHTICGLTSIPVFYFNLRNSTID